MSDITINNDESQNKNQKTTPVIESFVEPKEANLPFPEAITIA